MAMGMPRIVLPEPCRGPFDNWIDRVLYCLRYDSSLTLLEGLDVNTSEKSLRVLG